MLLLSIVLFAFFAAVVLAAEIIDAIVSTDTVVSISPANGHINQLSRRERKYFFKAYKAYLVEEDQVRRDIRVYYEKLRREHIRSLAKDRLYSKKDYSLMNRINSTMLFRSNREYSALKEKLSLESKVTMKQYAISEADRRISAKEESSKKEIKLRWERNEARRKRNITNTSLANAMRNKARKEVIASKLAKIEAKKQEAKVRIAIRYESNKRKIANTKAFFKHVTRSTEFALCRLNRESATLIAQKYEMPIGLVFAMGKKYNLGMHNTQVIKNMAA